MKYRVRLDLILDSKKRVLADQIFKALEVDFNKSAQRISEMDKSFLIIEECRHDEDPPKPCSILRRLEK